MAFSDFISSVSSALNYLDLGIKPRFPYTNHAAGELRMELRSLKLQLVICFRKFGDHFPMSFSGFEGVIARIMLLEIPPPHEPYTPVFEQWIYRDAVPQVRRLAKQLADECHSSPLAVDDVILIADSILENVADLNHGITRENAIEAFEEQVTFLKDSLVFAKTTGVELDQHLMIHFQPFAISVARVFVGSQPRLMHNSYPELYSKCLTVIAIGTPPQVYQAYAQALRTSTPSSSAPAGLLENFLDSLISLLWNVLRSFSNSMIKDQLKVLYERLRFCRHFEAEARRL